MAREAIFLAVWRVNQKIPVVLIILSLLNIVVFFYLTVFMEKNAEDLELQFINQQSEVRKAEQGGDSAESPLVVYARGIKDLQRFRAAIPFKNELTGLVGEIFTLAESVGLQIDRISYNPKHQDEMQLLQYNLDFVVTGDYGQIKKFTHKIEQSSRLVTIVGMGLNRASKGNEVNLKLKLSTYFRTDAS